jgi:hypothetical protein
MILPGKIQGTRIIQGNPGSGNPRKSSGHPIKEIQRKEIQGKSRRHPINVTNQVSGAIRFKQPTKTTRRL